MCVMFISGLIKKYNLISVPVITFAFIVAFITIISLYSIADDKEKIRENTRFKLSSIADLKIDQINLWRNERLNDAKIFFNNASFVHDIDLFFKNPSDKKLEKRILPGLKNLLGTNYSSLILVNSNLVVKYSLNSQSEKLSAFEDGFIKEALEGRRILFSDIVIAEEKQEIHFDLVIPLIEDNKEIGAMLLRIDPDYFLFPYVKIWPVPSLTSETLIIERVMDSVLFINDLRHIKNTGMKLKIPLTRSDVLAVKGVMGSTGYLEGKDYRGKDVLGFIKKIPGTKWLIIAKTDADEVFAASKSKSVLIYSLLLIVSICSAVVVFLYIKNQSKTQYSLLLEAELEKQMVKTNLDASEAKFVALFNSMKEGVAIHKVILNEAGEPVDYVIIDINPAYEKNTGITLEAARGSLGSKLYQQKEAPYLKIFSDVAITGKDYEFETYFAPLKKHFRISVTSPGHLMFATIFLDITAIKEKEMQLQKTITSLEQSNKELEQFAYVASHDLQEPLRMVSSFTQLLAKKYKNKLGEEADSYIHYTVDGAARMQILINDLLEYSRVTRKGKPFVKIDTYSALGQAVAILRKKIEDENAIITNGELPEIFADEGQIIRLFQNLIDNSLKYKSDDTPLIHISANGSENEWVFSVKDNGIGIEPIYRERIFEIFERLHSSSKYPGTGIGLAICKKIVERHGGKIWVDSNEDKGVTFHFSITKKEE